MRFKHGGHLVKGAWTASRAAVFPQCRTLDRPRHYAPTEAQLGRDSVLSIFDHDTASRPILSARGHRTSGAISAPLPRLRRTKLTIPAKTRTLAFGRPVSRLLCLSWTAEHLITLRHRPARLSGSDAHFVSHQRLGTIVSFSAEAVVQSHSLNEGRARDPANGLQIAAAGVCNPLVDYASSGRQTGVPSSDRDSERLTSARSRQGRTISGDQLPPDHRVASRQRAPPALAL